MIKKFMERLGIGCSCEAGCDCTTPPTDEIPKRLLRLTELNAAVISALAEERDAASQLEAKKGRMADEEKRLDEARAAHLLIRRLLDASVNGESSADHVKLVRAASRLAGDGLDKANGRHDAAYGEYEVATYAAQTARSKRYDAEGKLFSAMQKTGADDGQ